MKWAVVLACMATAVVLACMLTSVVLGAEQVELHVGMKREAFVAAMKSLGAKDETPYMAVTASASGLYWSVPGYDIVVEAGGDKEITSLRYNTKKEFGVSKSNREETAKAVASLRFESKSKRVVARPLKDLERFLGQWVELTGEAQNAKVGARAADQWIDLELWDETVRGKTVRVTGRVEERFDLPVFIQKPGEFPQPGIPVPEGTDLKAASRRLVVTQVVWAVVEPQPK